MGPLYWTILLIDDSLDASALVKLVVDEEYSVIVKAYIHTPDCSWRVCTSLCFSEAMGALKQKLKRREISEKVYVLGARNLISMVRRSELEVLKADFTSHSAFADAERMAKEHRIDFIDAFQLVSCRSSWSHLGPSSQPLLVTADGPLSKAAREEGIKCWYCRETHRPTC